MKNDTLPGLAPDVSWYREAAEQGGSDAQNCLGRMYDLGEGVTQDDATAVSWYRKAAEQGHADAQFNLGWMYECGQGVAKDPFVAASWYLEAAQQGYAKALNQLGRLSAPAPSIDDEADGWESEDDEVLPERDGSILEDARKVQAALGKGR